MSIEHIDIGTGEIHEPKGIASALAGEVYVADGAASGDWSAFGVAQNEKIVNSIDDFPEDVSGFRQLDDNIRYVLGADITTTSTFIAGTNNSITAFNINSPTFEYLGTGTFFVGTDVNFDINHIQLNCPNGKLFDFTDSVGGTKIFTADTIRLAECATFGTFDDLQSLVIENSSCLDCNTGITLTGSNWIVLSLIKFALLNDTAGFTGIDLGTSVHINVEMNNLLFISTVGGTGISGLAANANISANNIATVTNSTFNGVTALSGITEDDFRYSFFGNTDIADTVPDGFLTQTDSVTETVIAVATIPVLVAGTWTIETTSQFTGTAAGRLTYNGEKNLKVPISVSISSLMASGADKNVGFCLYKNGSIIANSCVSNTVKASAIGNTSVLWQENIVNGDYFEVFVSNDDDTVNVIVQDIKFVIN